MDELAPVQSVPVQPVASDLVPVSVRRHSRPPTANGITQSPLETQLRFELR
jgi:hypothetical protein